MEERLRTVVAWVGLVALWLADVSIWVMLLTRSNERRIQPPRVTWPKGLKRQLMRHLHLPLRLPLLYLAHALWTSWGASLRQFSCAPR